MLLLFLRLRSHVLFLITSIDFRGHRSRPTPPSLHLRDFFLLDVGETSRLMVRHRCPRVLRRLRRMFVLCLPNFELQSSSAPAKESRKYGRHLPSPNLLSQNYWSYQSTKRTKRTRPRPRGTRHVRILMETHLSYYSTE